MELPGCKHLQHSREPPAEARSADAKVCLRFREMQRLDTVFEHGAVRVLKEQPSRFDLGEMNEQFCAELALLSQQTLDRGDELVIAKLRGTVDRRVLFMRCRHVRPPCSPL